MRGEVIVGLLLVMLVVGAAIGYLSSAGNIMKATSLSTATPSLTTSEFVAATTDTTLSTVFMFTGSTSTYQTTSCDPFVGCVPIDVPVVLSASVNESSGVHGCGTTSQGYPQSVVCDVTLSAGAKGIVVLNMTSQNGNSSVAFGTYSSSQYVQFTSTYPCLYTTGAPDYNIARCPVTSNGTVYGFSYTVSQDLLSQAQAVLTIEITKTCCWP